MNEPKRYLHPTARNVLLVKPYLQPQYERDGYMPAPWDCVCVRTCTCNKRPTEPPADRIDEARASLAMLKAGIAAADEKQATRGKRAAKETPNA